MEGGKYTHQFREVKSVNGGFRVGMQNSVGAVEMDHEFGASSVTTLHVLAVAVEGGEQDTVTSLVNDFWATMFVRMVNLRNLG